VTNEDLREAASRAPEAYRAACSAWTDAGRPEAGALVDAVRETARTAQQASEALALDERARGAIRTAAERLSTQGARALDALLSLGEPRALHDGGPAGGDGPTYDAEPDGSKAMRPGGGTIDRFAGDALCMWRSACREAGVPLPAPGKGDAKR
jgi:hypothetical protein